MAKYYNILHPRSGRSPYLPCLTPGCRAAPLNLVLSDARALLEYRLRDDPASVFKAICRVCGKESTYNYQVLLALTPEEFRPMPIPDGCDWAVILLEFPTADEMPQRAFIGERVFVEGLSEGDASWSGYLASESQLAPTLQVGEIVGGRALNAHRLCEGVVRDSRLEALPLEEPRPGMDIASFFVPKKGHTSMLQCANVKCSNPSCAHYFGLTFNQFREQVRRIAAMEQAHGDDSSGYLILKCEVCQTSRVVDNRTFDGLFIM